MPINTHRICVALLALVLAACRTALPTPGAPRATYRSYAVKKVEVLVVATSEPTAGTDDLMKLVVTPPKNLNPMDLCQPENDGAKELSQQYATELKQRLQALGYSTTIIHDSGLLSTMLAASKQRGADAMLLVRYVPVTRATAGDLVKVEIRQIGRNRVVDTPSSVQTDSYLPHDKSGLLLLSTAQLFDTTTAAVLYRGPQIDVEAGDVPAPGSTLFSWGEMHDATKTVSVDPQKVAATASGHALSGLPQLSPAKRSVNNAVARRIALVEQTEAERVWTVSVVGQAGLVYFPIGLDIGPTTVDLDKSTERRFLLHSADLLNYGAYGGGLEVGYRYQRLLFYGRITEAYIPGTSRRTYVRSDKDQDRAFPIAIGPAHDVGIDALVGHQRLFLHWFGIRAAAGPMFRAHYIQGSIPFGSRLEDINFALGASSEFEPFVRMAPFEFGLRVQMGIGYDLANDVYGSGAAALRVGASF